MRGERYGLLQVFMQGRRSIGRRRISWLNNLRMCFKCSFVDLFRTAALKVRIAVMPTFSEEMANEEEELCYPEKQQSNKTNIKQQG